MVFKIFTLLVIFNIALSMPEPDPEPANIEVNVVQEVNANDAEEPKAGCCCPEECNKQENCFFVGSTYQCFCTFPSVIIEIFGGNETVVPNGTYANAADQCKAHGMALPHPYDIVALLSHSVQAEGECGPLWLNAYCSNNTVLWNQAEPNHFTIDNPLFCDEPSAPTECKDGDCLQYDCDDISFKDCPTKPYRLADCTKAYKNIICQKPCK